MLRARALEQALRMLIDAAVQTACKIAEDGDRRWHVVDLVCATNDAEKLLAVDPPPSGASQFAIGEIVGIQGTLNVLLAEIDKLTAQPTCRVCGGYGFIAQKQTIDDGWGEVDTCPACSDQPAPVSPVEPTTCPKCRSNTRAYRLAVADVIDGRMAGMTSCRDEWHSRMPMVSPVEPEPPVGSAAWLQSAGGSRMLGTASSKAVEPEPCVWRLSANGNYADAGCRPQEFFEAESVREWVACPYCGAPLKVEREQSDEQPSEISAAPRKPVVNLMDALRKSLESLDRTKKVPSEETPMANTTGDAWRKRL